MSVDRRREVHSLGDQFVESEHEKDDEREPCSRGGTTALTRPEERFEWRSLVAFLGHTMNCFNSIFHELKRFSMSADSVKWHAAAPRREHSQSNDDAVKTCTRVVIKTGEILFR